MDGGYGIEFHLISMIICLSICLVEIPLNSVENKLQISPKEFYCVYGWLLFKFSLLFLIIHTHYIIKAVLYLVMQF